MAEWKKVLVSGSGIHVQSITASGLTEQNTDKVVVYDSSTGVFYYTSSAGIGGGGIFIDRGTYYNTKNTLQISGSTLQSSPSASGTGTSPVSTGANNNIYTLLTSESIYSFNHNIGYPTANSWKENLQGSYFNNFDANTNVSEVLRFIAGLLSQSAPSPSPNTRTYNTLGFRLATSSVVTTIAGRFPSSSTNPYTTYLHSKGFLPSGSALTPTPVYSGNILTYTYSSSAGGTTTVSSSADAQLFGLGTVSETVYLSSSALFKFYSSSNEGTSTEQSSSETLVTISSPNSTLGGLSRTTIPTSNPAVIPSLYQDGKFINSFSSSFNPSIDSNLTTTSSIGWYHYSQSIGISTGSLDNFIFRSNNQRVFRIPENLSSLIGNNSITHTQVSSSLTAISRSLSGAPYLSQSTYNYTCTSSGLFNPLYNFASNIYTTTTGSSLITLATPINLAIDTGTGTINTSNIVYSDSTSTTARNTGVIPSEQDVIKVNSTVTFSPSAGSTNVSQNGLFSNLTSASITATGFIRTGGTTIATTSITYFTAGTFGQPAASGTMAYYNRAQGYDEDTFTRSSAGALSTSFKGESRRLQLTDKVLSGSYSLGDAWSTTFGLYNLGNKDLQVKPGFLVRPGGNYKYWLEDPAGGTEDYKYYAVGFTRDISSNQPNISMSLAGNTTLVEWMDTTTADSIAALIIPQSVLATSTAAAGIDPKAPSPTNNIASNTLGTNPFGRTLTILSNTNAQKTNPFIIDFPTTPAYPLNSTYRNFVLLLRYKGDPTPLTSVTFTITA